MPKDRKRPKTQDAESSLRLSASKEGYDPGQHKLSPAEGFAMIEPRKKKEH
jgi:hypothetical protein